MAEALTTDGAKLSSKDKTGLGYTGEKVDRNPFKRMATSSTTRITTAFDNPEETDPAEPHNRRSDPTNNKNRSRQIKNRFVK